MLRPRPRHPRPADAHARRPQQHVALQRRIPVLPLPVHHRGVLRRRVHDHGHHTREVLWHLDDGCIRMAQVSQFEKKIFLRKSLFSQEEIKGNTVQSTYTGV